MISYKFLNLSTFEEIEQKYLTRFSKYNFRESAAFINFDNTQYLVGGRNYGIQFYQRLKKTFQTLSFLKLKSKENFFTKCEILKSNVVILVAYRSEISYVMYVDIL